MILIDTSIWIELLSKRNPYKLSADQLLRVVVCLPVVQEILQGINRDVSYRKIKSSLLAFPCIESPLSQDAYLLAADIYRTGRQKGITIRSSTDCLIAALAIRAKLPVWHRDRDFDAISRFSSLKTVTGI